MKNKFLFIIALLAVVLTLSSCSFEETIIKPSNATSGVASTTPSTGVTGTTGTTASTSNPSEEGNLFTVALMYDGYLFEPDSDEPITVIWENEFEHYEALVDETGIAMITGLDGTYNVKLSTTPEDYTYNPNIYSANNDSPDVSIELIRISTTRTGNGRALYSEFEISKVGTFRAKITERYPVVYYEFQPDGSGYFSIESIVDITNGDINPKVTIYDGTFAYKKKREEKNDGGVSGSYTKNFKWVVNLADEMIGNVFTFAIAADTRTGVYPINVDFTIRYLEDFELEHSPSTLVDAQELEYGVIDDIDDYSIYTYTNSNGGVGDYDAQGMNGSPLLDGSEFAYNEETKVWHHLDENGQFAEKCCVELTSLTAYLNETFTMIESHGNKALTVNGLNHKAFIEQQYAGIVNGDGAVYVTMEMKNFLQMYAISQSLFFDGNGYIESNHGVTAAEEDQWLFAVGYYKLNA